MDENAPARLSALFLVFGLVMLLVLSGGCSQKMPEGKNAMAGPVVRTSSGPVTGTDENGIAVFRGIPYAAPPVGDLRWKPPAPVHPWSEPRNATSFGAICPQVLTDNPSPGSTPQNMSEDCLFLNVWSPAENRSEKLPVMVFIHGGAFMEGAGSLSMYDGSALAQKGVVVVTLNYRLGPLGFLVHPALDRESALNTSGNYGLMDQQAALRWVQANIGAFGGDPDRVTIFGESAGAASILAQLASPQAQGLFSQAIVESGPVRTRGSTISIISTKSDAEENGLELASALNATGPDALRKLRAADAMTVLNASPRPPHPRSGSPIR